MSKVTKITWSEFLTAVLKLTAFGYAAVAFLMIMAIPITPIMGFLYKLIKEGFHYGAGN